ncbi:MAG: acyl carrier protein [Gemmatimonadales bacterium]
MTPEAIRRVVLTALVEVAPDVDLSDLSDDRPLREQVEIDSYDFMQLLVAIHARLGVDVPERDYDQVDTLPRMIAYLGSRLPPDPT